MSINVTCPHCGATSDVSDNYARQDGPCPHCGKPIAIPSSEADSPLSDASVPPKHKGGHGCLIAILLALLVVGILIALLLPAVESAREAARRCSCNDHMKQIVLAMHSYQEQYKCFPPAFIADKNGKPMHSWRVLLLPYLCGNEFYEQYRFDEPWDGPHNRALAAKMPSIYQSLYHCPSDPKIDSMETSYVMLVGPHAISDGPTGRTVGRH